MKISILGDSLSTFYSCSLPNYSVFYTVENAMKNGLSGIADTWWYHVITMLGGELLVNGAYSGSSVSGTKFPSANCYERIKALQSDNIPDCIIVYMGNNDYGLNRFIYSEKNDLNCFYPAYITMLCRLQKIYPHARIICGTLMKPYITLHPNWHMPKSNKIGIAFDEYNQAIRKASAEFHVELADLAGTGIIYDTLDTCHGTNKGHREIAEAWRIALNL